MSEPSPPRPEHPRPHAYRERWSSLNGEWEFEIDTADSGLERGLLGRALATTIVVPFAPESIASGVHDTNYLEAVWYRRSIEVPVGWAGLRLLLHFGAVDYDSTIWVDGREVGRHRGGFASFTVDLGIATGGERRSLTVRARDPHDGVQARGKQSTRFVGTGPLYGRTTGIWQTVWVEAVAPVHLLLPRITPDVSAGAFHLELTASQPRQGWQIRATLRDGAGAVCSESVRLGMDLAPRLTLPIPEARRRLWEPGSPHLYGIRLELLNRDGVMEDTLDTYAGLRSVSIDGRRVLINGKRIFQRLVLDQGYWPDTLMTAPSDAALEHDIRLSMAAGFNGARLHQKVFEERFLYHADRLGYLVWAEFADWGALVDAHPTDHQRPSTAFVAEWAEVLQRDRNHPAIIGWCALNETWQRLHDRTTQLDDVTRALYRLTKLADPSRPVIDASGYSHRIPETDIWDAHNYQQDPQRFAQQVGGLSRGAPFVNAGPGGRQWSLPYRGQPYMISEFGGIWWDPAADPSHTGADRSQSWGYGERVHSEEEYLQRLAGLMSVLLDDPEMFGYCYTQLTDVFHERNGIYLADRTAKIDIARVARIQQRPAAYEVGSESQRQTRRSTPRRSSTLEAWGPHDGE